jgi:hypothetical protein
MHWKWKAHLLALVSRMPKGEQVYHLGQRLLGTNRLHAAESVQRAMASVALIREGGGHIAGSTCLEIGTGWRPFLPFILSLLGAERVTTWDVHPWLTRRYAQETSQALEPFLDQIAREADVSAAMVHKRYQRANRLAGSLRDLLEQYKVDYRCPADAANTSLCEESVDVVCSTNVLEHIPPDVLSGIHRESERILKSEGVAVHRIDPSDHFRFVDRSITGANFLQFSAEEWHWYGGSGLGYHNRLRCVEHREMMEAAGFAIVCDHRRRDEQALENIWQRALLVHKDFSRFSPEELAEIHISLAARPRKTALANLSDGVPVMSPVSV